MTIGLWWTCSYRSGSLCPLDTIKTFLFSFEQYDTNFTGLLFFHMNSYGNTLRSFTVFRATKRPCKISQQLSHDYFPSFFGFIIDGVT